MFLSWIKNHIVSKIVASGATVEDAKAFVSQFGDGHLFSMLIAFLGKNGASIWDFASFIASMFGIHLPPLPLPVPADPVPPAVPAVPTPAPVTPLVAVI